METIIKAFARLRAWKDEYAKRYDESMPDAEKNHAVAMEMFNDLEEYFIGAEQDYNEFEAMLQGKQAEVAFALRQGERYAFCYGQGNIDLLVKADDGIRHDSFHLPVLTEYVADGLACLQQYNDLPQSSQTFLTDAVTSLIRDQLTYFFPEYTSRCHCDGCEADRQQATEILAKADKE